MTDAQDFDAIGIGGGHAGIEASLALSRLGCKTCLITQKIDAIGRMSCSPSIGGLAKGNIVCEIEALGGEFNPVYHNAVMHVEDDSVGENIVVEEFEKGYTYRDQVIRHSMVKVAN